MRLVIVEDEARIARRIERMARTFFGPELEQLTSYESVTQGLHALETTPPDLLLLDPNLNGNHGFGLLESVSAAAFHTIIISAHADKASTAFAHGVLDFVPKPFAEERLHQAFARVTATVKKQGNIVLLDIQDLLYIKGAGLYTGFYLRNGKKELHDKSLEKLEQLLPGSFERIHKSYLVPLPQAEKIIVQEGSSYQLLLKNGELLPIGRSRYKALRSKLL